MPWWELALWIYLPLQAIFIIGMVVGSRISTRKFRRHYESD
jgi:uncharacterized membrane protein